MNIIARVALTSIITTMTTKVMSIIIMSIR